MEIIVATFNEDKLKEINAITEKYPHKFISLKTWCAKNQIECSDIAESGKTFQENSFIKAEAAYKLTGMPSLSDDTGLVVPALSGAPGIFSARYAVTEKEKKFYSAEEIYRRNREKLLKELETIDDRRAFFVCAATLFITGEEIIRAEGKCPGIIARKNTGAGGFGYDPIFIVETKPEEGPGSTETKTFAELTMAEKNRISHRGIALCNIFENFTEK